MATISRSLFYLLTVLFIFSSISSPAYANDQTVFGPKDSEISRWHVHLSFHHFNVDDPGDGVIIITKNTPEKKIWGGFLFLNRRPISIMSFLGGDDTVFEKDISLKSENNLKVFLIGTPSASITIEIRKKSTIPPPEVIFSADPQTITLGESSTLTWTTTNADSVSIGQGIGSVSLNGSLTVSPTETTIYTLMATGEGGTTTESVTITVHLPPAVTISADPATIQVGESSTLTWTSTNADSVTIDQGIGSVDLSGTTTVSPTETTTYTITATGPGGTATDSVMVTVTPTTPTVSISANPETIQIGGSSTLSWTSTNAQSAFIDNGIGSVPLNGSMTVSPDHTTTYTITVPGTKGSASARATVMVYGNPEPQSEGSFGEQYEDLIPPDATVEEYDPKRFSLITGLVQDLSGLPIADVSITIHSHPEYGTAFTDMDGRFSIPMEGGATFTLVYQKQGLIPAQRKVYVPWNDIAIAKTIQMITEDPVSTIVTFDGNPDTIVTHQSTEVTDEFGSRSCTMVFTGDNKAYLVDEGGNDIHELTTINTRATEFTTPDSMPAMLPPNSAYTYCAELSIDGAERVRFDKPVITWVDNFLGFDVGGIVPVGYYDRDRGFWVPSENGVVVKLLDTDTNGIIDALDADGDDQPDDLNNNGSYSDEVVGLDDSVRYPPGSIFWRVALAHFSPCDCNWPFNHPRDAIPPNPEGEPDVAQQKDEEKDCQGQTSSFVEQRSRIFHEGIPIPGTDITLHYASNRVEGYKTVITIPASGETVPDSLKRIVVKVELAGQSMEQVLDALPNQTMEFIWDGLDHLGRPVKGTTNAHVSVGFVYDSVYYSAANFGQAFAQAGSDATQIRSRQEVIFWRRGNLIVFPAKAKAKGRGVIAEGWTISSHHYLNLIDFSTLHKGDGTLVKNNVTIIETVAGTGYSGYSGDGGPATEAYLNWPSSLVVDAEGSVYIADYFNFCIRKVGTNGIITTVAGNGVQGYSSDGGPATQTCINYPAGMAVDALGNIYFSDTQNCRIRKVDTNGIITTVAGNGTYGYSGDGGPATEAQVSFPFGVGLDASGNLYITDKDNHCIRKVDTNGIITTVAGNGVQGYSGDGGPAIDARFYYPIDLAFNGSDDLYIVDHRNHCIRKVGLPSAFVGVMIAGDIPFAEKNGLGYIISSCGQHKSTIDMDTGVTLYEFGYDGNNNLISITDCFGNVTSIEWVGDVPTSITSPDGIITSLTIDANNHLTRITYPDGNYYDFEYTSDGRLTAKTEPEGSRFEHIFDSTGRLTDATDQEGGHWNYARTAYENGDILTEVLTGEGNLTSYLDHTYSTGFYESTITDPTGAETRFTQSADGLTANKSLPCGMEFEFKYDVDSEYKFKVVKEMTETAPSSLERVTLRDKIYQDTNSDDIPDLITETVTVNSNTTALENNVLQSQKTITSPEGRTVTTLYDPETLLTTSLTILGFHDTTYGHDTRGRLTSINTDTRETTFAYNAQGFLESITDPEDYTTTYTYDPVGRMTSVNRPDGTSIGFSYDNNGNMTVLTNPSLIVYGFGYSGVNLNTAYQTPLSGTYSYVYDKDRRLNQINFPSGKQINNIYDTTRLMQIQTPEGNIDFTYLCGTKVGSITNGTDTITYGYDGSLITSETLTGTLNQSLSYGYNNDFNLETFTYAGNTYIYTYDYDDLLTGAGAFTIFRNAGNGLPESVSGGSLNLSRIFNAYGEVEDQNFTISSQDLTSWGLTRDNAGRIKAKTETVDGTTSNYAYTYDPMGRLRTVTKDGTLVEEYQYSANGTRTYEMNELRGITGRSYAYSDEDHLLTAGGSIYEYDLDGFLTTKTFETDVTQYDYSTRGELLSVTLPDGKLIEYNHDPLGRRIAKKIDGVTVEKYLWQGLTSLLAVYDGADNLLMRFEYADGRMPVAMTKGGFTYYLTYDQVGSLRVVADSAGNVVKRIDYDSFGNIINDTDPAFEIPFGFAGGLYDKDTGLVRFGYRDYSPDVGRWTAKDPILFAGGDTDLWGYCVGDPVNWVDQLGLYGFGDIVSAAITTATVAAKQAGHLTPLAAGMITVATAPLADLISPNSLNAGEKSALEHYRTMQEIGDLNKRIESMQRRLDAMQRRLDAIMDILTDAYDWDNENPC